MEYINNIIDKSVNDIQSIFDYENIIIRDLSDKIHDDEYEDHSHMNYVIKTNKIPLFKIYEQFSSGYIKIFSDFENKAKYSFILKISGIWETQINYGLTYKFIKTD